MAALGIAPQKHFVKCTSNAGFLVFLLCGVSLSLQTDRTSTVQKQQQSVFGTSNSPTDQLRQAANQALQPRPAQLPLGGVDVLSDTRGVDFGPYLARLRQNIQRHWLYMIPEVARPPIMKKGKAVIEFAILKNGQLDTLNRVDGSGDVSLDRAAWGAVAASNPFPPLPSQFCGQHLALRFHFYYNPSLKSISPTDGAQVAVGSSQQFLPTLEHLNNPEQSRLTWAVNGLGCQGGACGTISATGLYTAPPTVPMPPTVIVRAKAPADLGEEVSSTITIVSSSAR